MSARQLVIGDTFCSWTFLGYTRGPNSNSYGNFKCTCGVEKTLSIGNVKRGKSTQCERCRYDSMKKDKHVRDYPNAYAVMFYNKTSKEDVEDIIDILRELFPEDKMASVAKIDSGKELVVDNFYIIKDDTAGKQPVKGGVYFQKQNGKGSGYYSAKISVPWEEKRRAKAFSVGKNGEDGARQLAEELLAKWNKEVVEYNQRIAKEQGVTALVQKLKEKT